MTVYQPGIDEPTGDGVLSRRQHIFSPRHIADFIAGMTDRYAITQCNRIYGSTPEGLSNV